jgi:peptidoglycan-N-acetylglucosamine deacetylase
LGPVISNLTSSLVAFAFYFQINGYLHKKLSMVSRSSLLLLNYWFVLVMLIASVCASGQTPVEPALAPIRFLLTFDDGPSGAKRNNATKRVLDVLDKNAVQPNIKALFFIQTRAVNGGGTDAGHKLLLREQADGHLLAFHSSTPRHANHRFLSPEEFELSLQNGIDDLAQVSGVKPRLVRPPFWSYDARTLEAYHRYGLQMLLTDLSANDGVIYGVNWSWHKRSNLLKHLRLARADWERGALPVIDGVTPIVVTFHDVNSYTARTLEIYLKILLDVANELDMPLAEKSFYDNRSEIERAALARTVRNADEKIRLPGIWSWLWQ